MEKELLADLEMTQEELRAFQAGLAEEQRILANYKSSSKLLGNLILVIAAARTQLQLAQGLLEKIIREERKGRR